ncbi:MAG: VOC family protein [Acidobacteria bacterium]|nr:VOC family protein [Acidobacteriota bacterium]
MAKVRYFVDDVDASVSFYVQHLGFKSVLNAGPFAMVEKDDLTLWISGPKTSAAKPMLDGRVPEPGGWNRFVFEVDDIEAVVASMKQAGINFRNDIISGVGGKQIIAEDPSGNPIEVFQAA